MPTSRERSLDLRWGRPTDSGGPLPLSHHEGRTEPITVSLIMPVRNEAQHVERGLGAVLAQNYPADCMEILVVDGLSEDGTRDKVRSVLDGWKARGRGSPQGRTLRIPAVRLLANRDRTAPSGLNIGLREARGNIIILVGGHCELSPSYVRRCVEVLRETGADCVGGPMETVGETRVARAVALALSSVFGVGGVAFRTGRHHPGYVDTVAFGAYRREVFERIGSFDEVLVRNQDDELNFRLIQAGGKIWLDPSIQSTYYSRADLQGLWRQYFQYGLYKVLVIQKRRAVPSWRHLVSGAFVLALAGSLILALLTRQPGWALTVVGPYAVANLLASLWTARRDMSALPVLPVAFASIHLAYGLGFLLGLWRWRRSRSDLTGDVGSSGC